MGKFLPGTFAQAPNGDLVYADGVSNVQRWDGLLAAITDAGLAKPASTPGVTSSDEGVIVGTIYAVVRYLDVSGRVSNVSAISTAHTISITNGVVGGATNADPISISDTGHGLTTGKTVKIIGVRGNSAANGTWVMTRTDDDNFTLDSSQGNGVYTGGGTWIKGARDIDYSSLDDASSITNVTRKQILRSKDGNANVYYIDLDTDVDGPGFALDSTTALSTNIESALGDAVALLDTNGNDLNVTRHSEPIPWKRVITHHYDRLFMAVDAPYSEGGVKATNASTDVVGLGTDWTSEMADWELFPDTAATIQSFTGSSINTSTQTLTLDENFVGTTDQFARYSLRKPGNERRTFYYSEAGLPYSFDLLRGLTATEDPEAGEWTGMMPYRNFLYFLFEHRIYRFIYGIEPSDDGDNIKVFWRGCVNQRTWVIADGVAYIMDRKGVFAFAGGGDNNDPISLPVQSFFEGDGKYRISWENAEYFHAAHYPSEETIKWFVCLDGSLYPKHAIVYQYRHKRWGIQEYPFGIPCSALGELNGRPQVFLGSTSRRVFADNHGTLDGINPLDGTVRGTATSSDHISLTDSAAAFHTSNLAGMPVRITEGKGAGQSRIISASTATKLTIVEPWTNKPDTTSVYQVGGFKWKYRTGWYEYVQTDNEEKRAVKIRWEPTANASTLRFRYYEDDRDTSLTTAKTAGTTRTSEEGNGVATTDGKSGHLIDTTKVSGFIQDTLDSYRGVEVDGTRVVQVELDGVPNTERQVVNEIKIDGVTP